MQATLLFRWFQQRVIGRWLALNERAGARVPPLLKDERLQRGWLLLMAAVMLAAWWFLGTAAGARWVEGG